MEGLFIITSLFVLFIGRSIFRKNERVYPN